MVGAKKVFLSIGDLLRIPSDKLNVPVLLNLLSQYYTIEINGEGSKEHMKMGLTKDKVVVKAYGKRPNPADKLNELTRDFQGDNKNEP